MYLSLCISIYEIYFIYVLNLLNQLFAAQTLSQEK